jgi:hypothetical protein
MNVCFKPVVSWKSQAAVGSRNAMKQVNSAGNVTPSGLFSPWFFSPISPGHGDLGAGVRIPAGARMFSSVNN